MAERVEFAYGTEDFDYDRRGRRLIVSAQDRRPKKRRLPGAIWAVPFQDGRAGKPYKLQIRGDAPPSFHPAGLSLWDDGSRRLVFVVNRGDGLEGPVKPTVEVFELLDDALRKLRPITSPALRRPNGIVAAGPDEVYVSNDGRAGSDLLDNLAKVLRIGAGNVLRCSAAGCRVVAQGIAFANGLAVSQAGDRLYVASFDKRRIRVYPRREDGSLEGELEPIKLESHPDNLKWEDRAAGVLNVACHRSRFATFLHLRKPQRRAPSDGFRIQVASPVPKQRLFGPDAGLNATSTALVLGRKLVVSFLVDDGIAVLDAPDP